jgi:MutS domain V
VPDGTGRGEGGGRGGVSGPRETYTERERRHAEGRDRARHASLVMSSLRMATFLGGVAAWVLWNLLDGTPARAALVALAVLVAGFVVLVGRHRRIRAEERRQEVLRALSEEGLLRLDRRWAELEACLPRTGSGPEDVGADHAYGADLSVFGTASLARLAGPVTSPAGRRILRGWLLAPAAVDVVARRQEAVRELARAIDFRTELAARGRLAEPSDEGSLEALLRWAEATPWLAQRRWTRVAAWVLPPVVIAMGILEVPRRGIPGWVVPLALQLWVLARVRRRVVGDLAVVEEGAPALQASGPQLRLVEEGHWSSSLAGELTGRLGMQGEPAHRAMARLVRLTDVVESRRNMFYVVLAPILLLDLHLTFALDRWRARRGKDVRKWLDALGEMEALSALATLGHDHPDWTMPEWDRRPEAGVKVRARALGHPLLPPGACVRNDVDVGPAGTFLFITGSNMSGKSTLLRALGANVVLAGAGAPVCAAHLSLPPVRLWTSMRVDESLADGVSRFMAELLRVRAVVRAARAHASGEPPVLYLLDEMLQGTNTAERRVAARAVIRHLLVVGAIGGVTSHDLTLADAPDLVPRRRAFHFRERVEPGEDGTRLSFDYVLRPGVATTRNALRLLAAVGLGPVEGHDEAPVLDDDEGDDAEGMEEAT